MSQPDLDAYFQRIQYTGPRDLTPETLHAISAAHVRHIPFENLDILLGRPISLHLPAIEKKLIREHRGGYCFEQNRYLLWVLETLGFHARLLAARVRWQRPRHYVPARTHVFVLVELDNTGWLLDVGIGSLSLTSALVYAPGIEQTTPHDTRRIVQDGYNYYHQIRLGNEWHDVCDFTFAEVTTVDCEVANWYTCTYADSTFRHHINVARAALEGRRITLNDNIFALRDPGGHAHKRELSTHAELFSILSAHFGIRLPAGTRIDIPGVEWRD